MNKFYAFLLFAFIVSNVSGQVVISQAYGGGGNSGSTYTHDFIELFNRGTEAVNLDGYSVQYSSAAGATFTGITLLPDFVLQPGQYFLIQQGQGSGGTVALPSPDLLPEAPISMSGTNFKIVLANTIEAVTGCDDTNIVDLVGFGSASCAEGTAAPALSNTTSGSRLFNGCQDSGNNVDDFVVGEVNPRNSNSPISVCSSGPSLAISSPSNNQVFAPNSDVTVNFVISNFAVGQPVPGIDGHIHYYLNDVLTMKYDVDPIQLNGLASGTYTFTMELVDPNHQPLDPAVTSTISFEIAGYTQVDNLLALRQDVLTNGEGKYYQVGSTPVITYARTARNQKYVQDATAAILIDDNDEVLSTEYVIGDALSSLRGRASYFNGLLQLIPSEVATVSSSNNTIVPQTVNIEMLNENLEAYESELVYITNVSITEGDGTAAFSTNTNYDLTDSQNQIVLRTSFAEADYIDQTIPQGQTNVFVLVAKFVNASGTTNQVIARNMADLDATLSAPGFNAIVGLKMYPNPATDNITIQTPANLIKNVAIYNVLGKEVLNTMTTENVSISSLNAGIYIVKITENGITATRKLIIN
uniref:lamin tail domain-containing protein n=1 Tax=Flavobacterium sp. TaxID=239 RepID=UPI00404B8472